jgi:hypothetical protein
VAKMRIGGGRRYPSSGGSLEEPLAHQKRLHHRLNRLGLFAHCNRKRAQPHWSPGESNNSMLRPPPGLSGQDPNRRRRRAQEHREQTDRSGSRR